MQRDVPRGLPAIKTAAEIAELFTFLQAYTGGARNPMPAGFLIPYFALATFAGLRPSIPGGELWKMGRAQDVGRLVDVPLSVVRITPEIAKTGAIRQVKMRPNLGAWLRAYPLAVHPLEGVMHGEDVGPDLLRLPLGGLRQAFAECLLHFPDALFHGPVVLRVVGGAVERDDPVVGEDAVDGRMVEGAAVVALPGRGGAPACFWKSFSRCAAIASPLDSTATRAREAVPGTEVLDRVDVEPIALLVFSPFRAVDGPGQVGFLPGDVLADLPPGEVALGAFLGGHFRDAAPGRGPIEYLTCRAQMPPLAFFFRA